MPKKLTPKKRQRDAASRSLALQKIAQKGKGSTRVFSAGRTSAERKADANRYQANTGIKYEQVGLIDHLKMGADDGEMLVDARDVPIVRSRTSTGKRSPVQRKITKGWAGKPDKRSLG